MLKPQDIEIQRGVAPGGDFMTITHKPTGIRRGMGPPLLHTTKLMLKMLGEMEVEVIQQGLMQHILPDRSARR